MRKDDIEQRTLTPKFPNLSITDGKAVFTMEVDTTTLNKEGKYAGEALEKLINTIAAKWVKDNSYAGRGTIWQWGSPSVNFHRQSYSMFYAFLGMPESFRTYLNAEIRVLKECVRVNSDCLVPDPSEGWDVLCHIEDQKVWEPLDPSLWQEVKCIKEYDMKRNEVTEGNDIVVYQNSKMDTVYYDNDAAAEGDDCEVKIGNNEIIVSYEEGDGFAMYRGREISQGHFELQYPENNGKASLHMFAGSKILEGFWIEDGAKGFWRIYLEK